MSRFYIAIKHLQGWKGREEERRNESAEPTMTRSAPGYFPTPEAAVANAQAFFRPADSKPTAPADGGDAPKPAARRGGTSSRKRGG